MELKEQILEMLVDGERSGGKIAETLGVSRAAVWKCVRALQKDGHNITAVTGSGYRLGPDNMLSAVKIKHFLRSEWRITTLAETTSTNDEAKRRAAATSERFVVIADRQTAGRGRLSRGFSSPAGAGLYMSAVVRPSLTLADCGKITAYAGVVTARAVEKLCGEKVQIKWVNDLYMNGKKICGILTESSMSLESGTPEYAVVGIGVNVLGGALPDFLKDVATSVEAESGKRIDRNELAALILDGLSDMDAEIEKGDFLDEYRARSCVVGHTVKVNDKFYAEALAIDDDCALLLKEGEKTMKFSAGEVSLKL